MKQPKGDPGPNDQPRFKGLEDPIQSKGPAGLNERVQGGQGSSPGFNLQDLRARLQRLRTNASVPIRNLDDQLQDDFRTLVNHIRILYGTESYPLLSQEVQNAFSDVTNAQPGTVGAYFCGCMISPNMNGLPGCSAICAGSMPHNGSDFCQYPVYLALHDSKGYTFTKLNEGSERDQAVVFIDPNSWRHNRTTFPGFSDEEKEFLQREGLSNVNLMSYSKDGKAYNEILGGFKQISELASRVTTLGSGFRAPNMTLIVLFVLLVIVLVFVFFRIRGTGVRY